jgi:pimeloyl-ACP methyl ester carboxylesterase
MILQKITLFLWFDNQGEEAACFQALRAPAKRLIWFENSAHNIPFEEPALFNSTVIRVLPSPIKN